MPRKPLPKKHHNRPFNIGPLTLAKLPEFAKRIGVISALWTEIDLHMAVLLAALLKADTPATIAVYQKLRRSTGRTEAIEAAFLSALPGDGDSALLTAFLRYYRHVEIERNALVHNAFGCLKDDKSKLLWIDIQHLSSFLVESLVGNDWKNKTPNFESTNNIAENVFYYTLSDLDSIITHERALSRITVSLWRYSALKVVGKDPEEQERQFLGLINSPPIAEGIRLQQERAARKSAKECP
jgi:hypothetical protein